MTDEAYQEKLFEEGKKLRDVFVDAMQALASWESEHKGELSQEYQKRLAEYMIIRLQRHPEVVAQMAKGRASGGSYDRVFVDEK